MLLDPYAHVVHFSPSFSRQSAHEPGSNIGKAPLGVLPRTVCESHDSRIAKCSGIDTLINLRLADELDFDEQQIAKQMGFAFHNVPFKEATMLTDDVFDKVREPLNSNSTKPTLPHCNSANRFGAAW